MGIERATTNKPVQFRYALFQDVTITALGITGRVLARCERGEGMHEYRVVYFAESKREDQWLFDFELAEKR